MKRPRREAAPLGRLFSVSLLLKGADGILEIAGGILFLAASHAALNGIVLALTQHELSEDPRDLIALHLQEAARHFGEARIFGAVYLLSHGLSKLVLVLEIFRGRLWAYPGMLGLLGVFVAYQSYRLVRRATFLIRCRPP